MELHDCYKSSDIKITEIDTIFVNSQVLTPFCILWSKDNKVLVTVEEGVFVFELWPTPLSEKPSVSFLKSWIPCSTSNPLSKAVVKNENGSFLWSLDRKQAYETVIDSTLSSSVERSNSGGALSYFTHCEFSPLICNRSYLTCLTNTGVLEIYKDQLKKWVPVVNVTDLWILYCNFKSDLMEIDFNTFKSRMFQLKITTMKWVEEPDIKFITGHENGTIVFWDINASNDSFDIRVKHVLSVDEKPECIQLHLASDSKNFLVFIGFRSGIVKCFSIDLVQGEKKMEVTLWDNRDTIVPNLIFIKTLFNELFVLTIKRHIILVQNLLVNKNQIELVMTKWEEFPTAITGWHDYQGMFILNLQNHDMYAVAVKKDNDKKFMLDIKRIFIEIKEKQKSSYGSFGLTMSQNKIFWILVSSAKVNYDSPKGITYLTIYSPELKIFKSLVDSTSSGLIDKILVKFKGIQLNEIFDLLELKKLELFKGSSKFSENYKIDGDLSLLKLQLMLWEVKFKFSCNLIESELQITEIEYCIIRSCTKKVVENLDKLDTLSPVQKRSLAVCQLFLKYDKNRNNLIHESCPVCASECIFYNTRILSCPEHKFPRCCLSLLPCDVVPYAFCRLCDAVALLSFDFVEEFEIKFDWRRIEGIMKLNKNQCCTRKSKLELQENFEKIQMKPSGHIIPDAETMKRLKLAYGRKHCKVTSREGAIDCQSHSYDNYEKFRIRRNKANARERNRMLGLNKALDRLRSHLPVKMFRSSLSGHQKLSKIETLKIACNYISILSYILKSNRMVGLHYFIRSLTAGLSHPTARIIASSLGFLNSLRN